MTTSPSTWTSLISSLRLELMLLFPILRTLNMLLSGMNCWEPSAITWAVLSITSWLVSWSVLIPMVKFNRTVTVRVYWGGSSGFVGFFGALAFGVLAFGVFPFGILPRFSLGVLMVPCGAEVFLGILVALSCGTADTFGVLSLNL